MNITKTLAHLAICALMVALSGCGGGDDPAPVTDFPLRAGNKALVSRGSTDNFVISGLCTGTATIVNGSTSAATFEGVTALQAQFTSTINFTQCTGFQAPSGPQMGSITRYYDVEASPLGSQATTGEYDKFETLPLVLPASVKVGDTGEYAVLVQYADNTKAVVLGKARLSYLVEADSATTAFVTFIVTSFDNANALIDTGKWKYRIDGAGAMSLIEIRATGNDPASAALVYTKT